MHSLLWPTLLLESALLTWLLLLLALILWLLLLLLLGQKIQTGIEEILLQQQLVVVVGSGPTFHLGIGPQSIAADYRWSGLKAPHGV